MKDNNESLVNRILDLALTPTSLLRFARQADRDGEFEKRRLEKLYVYGAMGFYEMVRLGLYADIVYDSYEVLRNFV